MNKSLFSLVAVSVLWLSACTVQIQTDLTPTSSIPSATPSAVTPEATISATATVTDTGPVTTTDTLTGTTTVTNTDAITGTTAATVTATTTATDTMTNTDTVTDTATMTETEAITLPDTSNMTIAEIVQSVNSLSRLREAVAAADMEIALTNDGPLTVFLPGNAAFEGADPEVMAALLEDPALLTEILQYHIVVDQVDSTKLAQLDSVFTAAGQPISVTIDLNGNLLVNEAQIVYADIPAANGVIHVINQILTPPTLDMAMPVVNPDLIALANRPADDTLEQLKRADTADQTLVEIVKSISGLTIAATAIDAAGLNETLQDGGPFTLFVPTNPAFQELSEEELNALLNDPEALAALLQYHLVDGIVISADLETTPTLLNVVGEELEVRVQTNGRILINDAPVYQADIEAANGVIYVIGEVLAPPTE